MAAPCRQPRRKLLISMFVLLALGSTEAKAEGARNSAELLGEWWTEGNEGRIKFTRAPDGTFRGTTTCCRPKTASPENPVKDIHNPNPKLRERSTLGIVLIWKLAYDDGEYTGGYIYNPRDGKTYRFQAELIDRDTLRIRGYLGIPLLGQTQVWKRARAQAKQRSTAPPRSGE
jgi:uncharacterized protein (DUF2147 family)